MKNNRLELHKKLEEVFNNENIYYQPPENLIMKYPCIVYSKNDIDINYANNSSYIKYDKYIITIIDKKPDNPAIYKLLELPTASYDRHYISDNFNHDVVTLYY